MPELNPEAIAIQFNNYINNADMTEPVNLMTDDHRFIDSGGAIMQGKTDCEDGWRGFFSSFPDYKNSFENIITRGETVIITGHSICSDERLAGTALWTAPVKEEKVAEWRVYEDTPENRAALDLT